MRVKLFIRCLKALCLGARDKRRLIEVDPLGSEAV